MKVRPERVHTEQKFCGSIMTVFQAYCSNINDDNTWRFVLTFSDSSVADEWWRAVSEAPANIPASFMRINPQFYTHNPAVFNVINFFTDARTKNIAQNFRGRFFMTLINDRGGREIPIVESVNVANAISGNWFFIRSTADPTQFWYYTPRNNAFTVSNTGRTRFRITALQTNLPGQVLIGSDIVKLEIERTEYIVNIDKSGQLRPGDGAYGFLFGKLKNKNISFNDSNGQLQDVSDAAEGSGWTWELVE